MGIQRWGRTLIVSAAMVFGLGGCATLGAVHSAEAQARLATRQSQQALAMARAAKRQRKAADKILRQRVSALMTEQKALLASVQRIESRAAYARRQKIAKRVGLSSAMKNAVNTVFARVTAQARALAAKPYKAPPTISPVLQKLSFSDYGKLGFMGRPAGWPAGSPFHLELYPVGYLFTWPERIAVVAGGKSFVAHPPLAVNGDPGLAKQISGSVPTAGFSAYTAFGQGPAVYEFLSFLGASYFRAVGKGQSWGLSARGVAVDTALPHRAEEFPYFRSFWILAPHPHARHLVFCGLLDSPSLTGAYRFIARPGRQTIIAVKVVLFERQHVRRLGIAPLTSMFLQGRFSHRRFDHLVRSAHDSDGLSIALAGGQRLWWPLRNPRRIAIYRFPLTNPQGFGLMQRARRAGDYRAFGMHYEDRPSAWVTPEGGWGPGHLVLVELPTNSQTNDNISAFWVPQNQANPQQPLTFRYRIAWQGQEPVGAHLGYVVAGRHAGRNDDRNETYVVDFTGQALEAFAPTAVTPSVRVFGPARVVNAWVTRKGPGSWRLQFQIARTGSGAVMMHATLMDGSRRLTETWAGVLPHAR